MMKTVLLTETKNIAFTKPTITVSEGNTNQKTLNPNPPVQKRSTARFLPQLSVDIFGIDRREQLSCDIVNASCELQMRVVYILRVTSCTYCASYELHLLCELRVKSKLRVGNSKMRVETKIASCLFSFEKRPFSPSNKVF